VHVLPVDLLIPPISSLLSHSSSRKRRCTFIASSNSCKECKAKDVKCSLSDHGKSASDRQRGARRPLLPLQQHPAVSPSLHIGPASSPLPVYDAPDQELINQLVEIYFDLIHDKQHILFHPATFMAQYHAGLAPSYLIWAMAALVSRYVVHPSSYWLIC
jgi:hypothetical protein